MVGRSVHAANSSSLSIDWLLLSTRRPSVNGGRVHSPTRGGGRSVVRQSDYIFILENNSAWLCEQCEAAEGWAKSTVYLLLLSFICNFIKFPFALYTNRWLLYCSLSLIIMYSTWILCVRNVLQLLQHQLPPLPLTIASQQLQQVSILNVVFVATVTVWSLAHAACYCVLLL